MRRLAFREKPILAGRVGNRQFIASAAALSGFYLPCDAPPRWPLARHRGATERRPSAAWRRTGAWAALYRRRRPIALTRQDCAGPDIYTEDGQLGLPITPEMLLSG
jgi:hypothetical protein